MRCAFVSFLVKHFGKNYTAPVYTDSSDCNKTKFYYLNIDGDVLNAKSIIYMPNIKRDKEKSPYWTHRNTAKCWFNEHSLNNCNDVIIAEGEKTASLLYCMFNGNIACIATGGATNLKFNFDLLQNKRILLLPDNDKPGEVWKDNLSDKLNDLSCGYKSCSVEYLSLNLNLSDFSDMGDVIVEQLNNSNSEYLAALYDFIYSELSDIKINRIKNRGGILSFGDMKQYEDEKVEFLIDGIIPCNNLVAIVAPPDTGKSQFARQLCLSICFNATEFAGFKLNTTKRKCLFVSTEDSFLNSKESIFKQVKFFEDYDLSQIDEYFHFVYYDSSEPENFMNLLMDFTKNKDVALIVIDSLSDIFPGSELNNNSEMRKYLKTYFDITNNRGCTILFVHHLAKHQYRKKASQEAALGASAFVAKLRTLLDLRNNPNDSNIKYLSITKGNYASKEQKSLSYELFFSEDTLCYSFTGNRINPNDESKSIINNQLVINREDWIKFWGYKTIKTADILEWAWENYQIKERNAYHAINVAIAAKIIIKIGHGLYKLSSLSGDEEIDNNSLFNKNSDEV